MPAHHTKGRGLPWPAHHGRHTTIGRARGPYRDVLVQRRNTWVEYRYTLSCRLEMREGMDGPERRNRPERGGFRSSERRIDQRITRTVAEATCTSLRRITT